MPDGCTAAGTPALIFSSIINEEIGKKKERSEPYQFCTLVWKCLAEGSVLHSLFPLPHHSWSSHGCDTGLLGWQPAACWGSWELITAGRTSWW